VYLFLLYTQNQNAFIRPTEGKCTFVTAEACIKKLLKIRNYTIYQNTHPFFPNGILIWMFPFSFSDKSVQWRNVLFYNVAVVIAVGQKGRLKTQYLGHSQWSFWLNVAVIFVVANTVIHQYWSASTTVLYHDFNFCVFEIPRFQKHNIF